MKGSTKPTRGSRPLPERLEDLPNVGPAMAADFRLLGARRPADLVGRDAHELYARLQRLTRSRQDPCVLDTFLAVVDYVGGAPARPWWKYTAERKRVLAARNSNASEVSAASRRGPSTPPPPRGRRAPRRT